MSETDDGTENSEGFSIKVSFEQLRPGNIRFESLELHNFLSYKHASLELSDFTALVGPNASGKSNAVTAIRLLREIPIHGLPTAIARLGGFDQLRHRSRGRPNDPSIRLCFRVGGAEKSSSYLLSLGAVKGGQYKIKRESAEIFYGDNTSAGFERVDNALRMNGFMGTGQKAGPVNFPAIPGQSALSSAGLAGITIFEVLRRMQTVEINPSKVGDLQEPSSTDVFESDGSNVASIFDSLDKRAQNEIVARLSAIVPGIESIEVARFADKLTLRFKQLTGDGSSRSFLAKQMSDGTLRAFAIMVALLQSNRPSLLIIEEPEVAIHLGALSSLVELLQAETEQTQVLITTHSADIVDALPLDALRIVWHEAGTSNIAKLAEHSKMPVIKGLITPGQLLRSDALDPSEK